MEGAILLVVAIGALGAFATGIILLGLYFRSGRSQHNPRPEPVVFGSLVQCPHCSYMNPVESAACLQCHRELPHPRDYQPPPHFQPTFMGDHPQYQAPTLPPPPQTSTPAPPSYQPPPNNAPPTDRYLEAPHTSEHPAEMPKAWLEGIDGAMKGRRADIQQGDILIGRSTVCDVQIYDPKVSRKHFRIRYGNGAFFLQDQQSSRGTRINGERVMAQRLNNGDRIEIGDTTMIMRIER